MIAFPWAMGAAHGVRRFVSAGARLCRSSFAPLALVGLVAACGGGGAGAPDGSGASEGGSGGTDAQAGGDASGDGGADAALADVPVTEPSRDCAFSQPEPEPECTPSGTGQTMVYVIDVLRLGAPEPSDPSRAPGVDLDGIVSTGADAESCFQSDFLSIPPEDVPGVDSQIGAIASDLGLDDDYDRDAAANIAAGELLTVIELTDVDDLTDDPCVHVHLLQGRLPSGSAAPMLDGESRFVPGQTFDFERASLEVGSDVRRRRFRDAAIIGGRLHAGPRSMDFVTPLPPDALVFTLPMHGVELFANVSADGLTDGVVAAAADRRDIGDRVGPTLDPGIFTAFEAIFRDGADLNRVGDECLCMSTAFRFLARPAVLGAAVD